MLTAVLFEALSFHADNSEFTITLTTSQRPVEYAGVVGDFTGAIICSMIWERGKPIGGLIKYVNVDILERLRHQSLSGPALVRMLRERQGNPSLHFPVVLTSLVDLPEARMNLADFAIDKKISLVYNRSSTPAVSLDIQCSEVEGALCINVDFDPTTYDAVVIGQLLKTYEYMLKQLASLPKNAILERPLSTFGLAPPPQMPEAVFTRTHLLHQLVFEAANRAPSKIAVIDQEVRISFADLLILVQSGSLILIEKEPKEGALIAIMCQKGWEQVIGAISILHIGSAYLPINPSGKPAGCTQTPTRRNPSAAGCTRTRTRRDPKPAGSTQTPSHKP